jgi:GT2 family glycosyltransferase
MKKVGVVVLNYKLKKEVDRALKSVFDSKEVELEVVLVDNDSDDGVSELTEKYPKLHFIQSGSNKGFSGGNNIGIKMILDLGCEYILLLNPDAWVDKYIIHFLFSVSVCTSLYFSHAVNNNFCAIVYSLSAFLLAYKEPSVKR